MRKTIFILLAAVLVLSAVDWDIEQITNTANADNYEPILVLDNEGKARVLYGEWGMEENVTLVVASNASGSWQFEDVAQVMEAWVYGLDVDADGFSHVTYFDFISETDNDIFYATNRMGPFDPVNLTDDAPFQAAPVLKLDRSGMPHIIFAQAVNPEENIQAWHGWITPEGFEREQVTENLYQDDWLGYDLVFDQLNQPHVFYIGDDSHLWHTAPGELLAWQPEKINELSSEWPSAVADPVGPLHVAYDVGEESIHYVSNMNGPWQDELVSDNIPPGGGIWRPSLALDNIFGFHAIGNPHIAWIRYDSDWWGDLWYGAKPEDAWVEEAITSEPETDEWPGYGHYFAIDNQNYGHIVYDFPDDDGWWQIMYAKSTEPLAEPVSVGENPVLTDPVELIVNGTTVNFSLSVSGTVKLDLFDVSGRHVSNLVSGSFNSGNHSIPILTTSLSSGVYFVRIEASGYQANVRFVLIK